MKAVAVDQIKGNRSPSRDTSCGNGNEARRFVNWKNLDFTESMAEAGISRGAWRLMRLLAGEREMEAGCGKIRTHFILCGS